jgi:hypothetical protein
MIKLCPNCNKPLVHSDKNYHKKTYCDKKCSDEYKRKHRIGWYGKGYMTIKEKI